MHPDDPHVFWIGGYNGATVCPDSPEQRLRFTRMWERILSARQRYAQFRQDCSSSKQMERQHLEKNL